VIRRILLYQALLIIGVAVTLPVWVTLLLMIPKLRAGFWQKLGFLNSPILGQLQALDRHAPIIWVHAVSVGEFVAIYPLVEDLLDAGLNVVLTTTTQTGQMLAIDKLAGRCPILYFPYDVFWAVQGLMHAIRPDLILLTETELWPYFLWAAGRRVSTSLWLINGRLSDKSFKGYSQIKPVLSPILGMMDHAFMQTKEDMSRFQSLLPSGHRETDVSVMGNLKFDLIVESSQQQQIKRLKTIFNFPSECILITIASTHEGEEALLLKLMYQLMRDFPEIRLVLAPRHPERVPQVAKLLREETFQFTHRTSLSEEHLNSDPVILLDTIGELKHIFHFSDLAIVAGSFLPHLGGHNILEPVIAGTPVVFGPYMSNFKEIVYTVNSYHAGIQVHDMESLKDAIINLMTTPEQSQALTRASYLLTQDHQGQRDRLMQSILQQLNWMPQQKKAVI